MSGFVLSSLSAGHPTSHAGPIGRVHSSHWLGHTGWMAHAALVDSSHTEHEGATLHQTRDGEAGKLDWCVVALDPVVGSHLTPAGRWTQLGCERSRFSQYLEIKKTTRLAHLSTK